MHQFPTEINDEYLYIFNYCPECRLVYLHSGQLCSFKTIDKAGEIDTPEEVTPEEEKFKAMLFLIRADESRYVQLLEYMRKSDFVGRYEYPNMINGAYELLVLTSSQFGISILRRGRRNFRY